MSRTTFNLKQAAEHVHLEMNVLKHAAQRGEVEATEHGGDWWFEHRALDEWAQRMLLASSGRDIRRHHNAIMEEDRRLRHEEWRVSSLFRLDGMCLSMPGKAKAGMVRDMSDLAGRTGLVYDQDGLFKELMERENTASTAVGQGAAFMHPRFHDPYLFEESFVAYGRSERPVFFGAPNGEGTRHFFLVCSTDHVQHLNILARLALMAHATEFLEVLDEVTSTEEALSVIKAAEEGLLR
ncbi:MAG: PTS sugar transporter subunit IIA [Kiritimatiellae bacterium]|nr:PTS sugar transporter subunit IIA [Kiritimatiellia bacterium]